MKQNYSIVVNFDDNIVPRGLVSESFDHVDGVDYDGGGFSFITGMRDCFFYTTEPIERSTFQKVVRNLRRRKGVNGVHVSIALDEEEE